MLHIPLQSFYPPKTYSSIRAMTGTTQTFVSDIKGSANSFSMGYFAKDAPQGKLADDWTAATTDNSITLTDVTPAMATVLAPKDDRELGHHTVAARLCSTVMSAYFKPKMEAVIDKGTKLTHEYFATLVEEKLGNDAKEPDQKVWSKNKQLAGIDFQTADWVYTPIIQSGGKYDLKVSAESNQDNLKAGVIIASMGIKFREYCSNIARTFMIGPHKSQESNYTFLLEVQQAVLAKMHEGVSIDRVYAAALDLIKLKKPDLADKFVKNIGFGTGIDFRESAYVVSPKNTRTLHENMVFVVTLGFAGIPDPKNKGKTYALMISDTVKVGKETGVLITEGTKKVHEVILDEEEEESDDDSVQEVKPSKKAKDSAAPVSNSVVVGNKTLRAKTRNQGKEMDSSKAEKLKQHQRELHEAIQKSGLAKYKGGKDGKSGAQGKTWKKFESYRRDDQLPMSLKRGRIYVDEAKSSVVLPIAGFITPFHISTIKNVSLTDEETRACFESISNLQARSWVKRKIHHLKTLTRRLSVQPRLGLPTELTCTEYLRPLQRCVKLKTSVKRKSVTWRM